MPLTYGYYNTPIVYNNNLYIYYVTADGLHHVTEYETATNSLKIYPNPGAKDYGYWDQPIVYDNNLFSEYNDSTGTLHLSYFDGTTLHELPNLNGNTATSYQGSPFIFQWPAYFPICWCELWRLRQSCLF